MKRLFVAFTLLALALSASSFASDEKSTASILRNFHSSFSEAKNVTVTQVADMTRIGFTMDGKEQFAYYNEYAELVVLSRQISSQDLPQDLRERLEIHYKDHYIAAVYLFIKDGTKEYVTIMKKGSEQLRLRASGKKWKMLE